MVKAGPSLIVGLIIVLCVTPTAHTIPKVPGVPPIFEAEYIDPVVAGSHLVIHSMALLHSVSNHLQELGRRLTCSLCGLLIG